MTSEVAGYQAWGDGRGIEGARGGQGRVEKNWMLVVCSAPAFASRNPAHSVAPVHSRSNSLPIYLRVSFYFYLRSVCFLIHVFWRFVVTIKSDVVIFTGPLDANAGIYWNFFTLIIKSN